jgi:hypothetical protein
MFSMVITSRMSSIAPRGPARGHTDGVRPSEAYVNPRRRPGPRRLRAGCPRDQDRPMSPRRRAALLVAGALALIVAIVRREPRR